jgi:hypothetical protein
VARDLDAVAIRDVDLRFRTQLPLVDRGVQPGQVNSGIDGTDHCAGVIDNGIADPEHIVAGDEAYSVRPDGEAPGRHDAIDQFAVAYRDGRGYGRVAAALTAAVAIERGNVIVFEVTADGCRQHGTGALVPAVTHRQFGKGRQKLVCSLENANHVEFGDAGELYRIAAQFLEPVLA